MTGVKRSAGFYYFDKSREKKMQRCGWVSQDPLYIEYHDTEWGVPKRDNQKLFEMICLEGQQAGLSWKTILDKKEAICEAFDNFQPEVLLNYDDEIVREIKNNAKCK